MRASVNLCFTRGGCVIWGNAPQPRIDAPIQQKYRKTRRYGAFRRRPGWENSVTERIPSRRPGGASLPFIGWGETGEEVMPRTLRFAIFDPRRISVAQAPRLGTQSSPSFFTAHLHLASKGVAAPSRTTAQSPKRAA